jgi:hypothetical protein
LKAAGIVVITACLAKVPLACRCPVAFRKQGDV